MVLPLLTALFGGDNGNCHLLSFLWRPCYGCGNDNGDGTRTLIAAMMGGMIPIQWLKLGKDPAIGSSVMITAITDTGGFFIF